MRRVKCLFPAALLFLWLSVSYAQDAPVSRAEFQRTREQQISAKRAMLERRRAQPKAVVLAQGGFDVKHYRLDLDIDPVTEQVSGYVEMTATALTSDLNVVELDFSTGMVVDGVAGDAAGFTHSADRLQLQLARTLANGETFTVRIDYHGHPESSGFGSFGFDEHNGASIIWSLSEPYFARTWWPCKDTPNDKADSVDVLLTVPDNLTAASNGVLVAEVDHGDGTRTFHWHESYPITTYLVSVAITNYEVYSEWFTPAPGDSMEVRYYVYPENFTTFSKNVPPTLDMLSLFHRIFGAYPFFTEKYGIAQFPWGGGMEHQTITSQGNFGTTLTVHELAHQWWGDKITNDNWHEIWLNEGFASYAEALYYEYANGADYYHTYMGFMDRYFPYSIYVEDTTSVSRIFNSTVYDKGAWFLHMLRKIVGDSTFFEILLVYSDDARFAYGNATTNGFQSVCESVSGLVLDWYFEPWIYSEGRPVYAMEWSATDSAGVPFLQLNLKQLQTPGQAFFTMPIDLGIETDAGDTLVTIFNNVQDQNFRIELEARPRAVELDPEGWILKRIDSITQVAKAEKGVPGDFSLHQNYPNPFNGETVISFELPQSEEVRLDIYNIYGQRVRELVSQRLQAGVYRAGWDGKDDKGSVLASGLYVYQILAGTYRQQKKLLLIK